MNPELIRWTGAAGLPRFDRIADADILPAVDEALTSARQRWEAIASALEAPTFVNTVLAMEFAEDELDRITSIFDVLSSTCATPAREAIERELAPRLAMHNARIMTDPRLLARVEAVWTSREGLAPEAIRLTELARRAFRRGGAGLDEAGRARMAEIGERMAVLTTRFSQNLLRDERDYALPVPDDRLGGLPGWLLSSMRAAAAERGLQGQVLTLGRSLLMPFLEHAEDRALRETAQKAWAARGSGEGAGGGETDNLPLIVEILALRHEKARLLGYADFAAFKLEPEMAGTAERVAALLDQVWRPALARSAQDGAVLASMLHADGLNGALEPWDWRFYATRRKAAEQALTADDAKEYLTLDGMLGAVFDVAQRLFGLQFEAFKAPSWHADVRAWRVTRHGEPMAVLLGDYFARPGKRSGAWCGALQRQHKTGPAQRAIVTNVCNFTPPAAAEEPALLSWDDARTLFHEFGHALHHILSDVSYVSISGTAVARDFVELPSQLFEHWMTVPAVLDRHARHVRTGAAMPAPLRDRLIAAETADAGFATVEYLESAFVDLALHRGPPPADAMARQGEVLAALQAPAAIPMRHAIPHFQHVFAGDGYSAGYYSYLWSEVMDADAFAAFTETGDPFDSDTACRLEKAILSRGGSSSADELWKGFRERMPGVEPLLRGRGLTPTQQPD